MKRLIGTAIVVLLTGAGLCSAADAKAGLAAYDKSCKSCHGAGGVPSAAMATAMKLRALGSPEVQALSDADMKKVITEGKGKMKGSTTVTGAAVDDVIAHIRTLKK